MTDQMTQHRTCGFKTPSGDLCDRGAQGPRGYCPLHVCSSCGIDDAIVENPNFEMEFLSLLKTNDGHCRGIVFPSGIKLPPVIDFPVFATESRLDRLSLDNVIFKEDVDFSDSIFSGDVTLRGVTFNGVVKFERCHFNCPVEFLHVICNAFTSFLSAEFSEQATIKASFAQNVNFNNAIFRDGVTFAGWRNVLISIASSIQCNSFVMGVASSGARPTLLSRLRSANQGAKRWIRSTTKRIKLRSASLLNHTKLQISHLRRRFSTIDPRAQVYRVFEREGQFQNVLLLRPDRTVFSQVDLFNVYLQGTNLRGSRFIDVKWWQPAFNRNGLRDEVFIRLTNDGPFRFQTLPVLEETCRNVRVALEENRSFNTATDFYVGEMDAARLRLGILRRHVFSVAALYNSVSRYGSSVGVAIRFLLMLFLLHLSFTLLLQMPQETTPHIQYISEAALRSFKTLLFQPPESHLNRLNVIQGWTDAVFRTLGLGQIAMTAFAFRARIKRQ